MRDLNPLTVEALLENAALSKAEVTRAGIEPIELLKIFRSHRDETNDLDSVARFVVDTLRRAERVHSTRYRIKNPYHLVRKLVRKASHGSNKRSRGVSSSTYREKATDLIGVRAIHLFKHDWSSIHDFIRSTWTLEERPVANVRQGDDPELTESFRERGLRVVRHPMGYRSIHYLAALHPARTKYLVEIQVRTIFEEGWSEIDHQVRYPDHSDNAVLSHFLGLFNRLSGSADEMGTFIQMLRSQMREHSVQVASALADMRHMQTQVNDLVRTLGATESQRSELQEKINALVETPRRELKTFGDAIEQLGSAWVSAKLAARERSRGSSSR